MANGFKTDWELDLPVHSTTFKTFLGLSSGILKFLGKVARKKRYLISLEYNDGRRLDFSLTQGEQIPWLERYKASKTDLRYSKFSSFRAPGKALEGAVNFPKTADSPGASSKRRITRERVLEGVVFARMLKEGLVRGANDRAESWTDPAVKDLARLLGVKEVVPVAQRSSKTKAWTPSPPPAKRTRNITPLAPRSPTISPSPLPAPLPAPTPTPTPTAPPAATYDVLPDDDDALVALAADWDDASPFSATPHICGLVGVSSGDLESQAWAGPLDLGLGLSDRNSLDLSMALSLGLDEMRSQDVEELFHTDLSTHFPSRVPSPSPTSAASTTPTYPELLYGPAVAPWAPTDLIWDNMRAPSPITAPAPMPLVTPQQTAKLQHFTQTMADGTTTAVQFVIAPIPTGPGGAPSLAQGQSCKTEGREDVEGFKEQPHWGNVIRTGAGEPQCQGKALQGEESLEGSLSLRALADELCCGQDIGEDALLGFLHNEACAGVPQSPLLATCGFGDLGAGFEVRGGSQMDFGFRQAAGPFAELKLHPNATAG